jgi:hypothetical protein
VCEWCRKAFTGRKKRYCCAVCRYEATKRRRIENPTHEKVCIECGEYFRTNNAQQKTCSRRCSVLHTARRKGVLIAQSWCRGCSAQFKPRSNAYNSYCSKQCWCESSKRLTAEREALRRIRDNNSPWKSWPYLKASAGQGPRICPDCGVERPRKWKTLCSNCRKARRKLRRERERSSPSSRAARRRAKYRRRMRERAAKQVPYQRSDIFSRDGWMCHICGSATDTSADVPHPRAPTIDHILPLSCGGEDTSENVKTACFICNSKRGNRALVA